VTSLKKLPSKESHLRTYRQRLDRPKLRVLRNHKEVLKVSNRSERLNLRLRHEVDLIVEQEVASEESSIKEKKGELDNLLPRKVKMSSLDLIRIHATKDKQVEDQQEEAEAEESVMLAICHKWEKSQAQ
jgi:hypothetical protein